MVAIALAKSNDTQAKVQEKKTYNHHLHTLLIKICAQRGIQYTYSDDTWRGALRYGREYQPIFGFVLGLNSDAVKSTCDDKPCTSDVLSENGVPNVEHRLFWKRDADLQVNMGKYSQAHNHHLVVKPRVGTCGKDISQSRTEAQLTLVVDRIFTNYAADGSVSLSPYYKIKNEFRLIMLNGEPQIAINKLRPEVVGDGVQSRKELILSSKHPFAFRFIQEWDDISLAEIPAKGESVQLTWKHNLCNGCGSELLDLNKPSDKLIRLIEIAVKTANALKLAFGSVDIVELEDQSLKVLEVNNGVMMENLIEQQGTKVYDLAYSVYEKAVCQLMGIKI